MRSRKNSEIFKRKKPSAGLGFYIALAICLVTIAGAAWTTYGSILQDSTTGDDESLSSDLPAANDVSGEPYEKNEEESEESSRPSEKESDDSEQPEPESDTQESAEPSQENKEPERVLPLEDTTVIRPFSDTKLLYSKTTGDWRTHPGADFKAPEGTAVRSVAEGVVRSVESDVLYGNTICIDHKGFVARYSGLTDQSVVREGDNVEAGTVIGYAGTVPCEMSEEPHIHLEVTYVDRLMDPVALIESGAGKSLSK